MSRKSDKQIRKKRTSSNNIIKRNNHIAKLEQKLKNCVNSGTSRIRSIYIFKVGKDTYKIGVAADPLKRLKGVQTGNQDVVEYIFSVKTFRALNVEALVHAKFNSNRLNGEWFKFNSVELIYVKNYINSAIIN